MACDRQGDQPPDKIAGNDFSAPPLAGRRCRNAFVSSGHGHRPLCFHAAAAHDAGRRRGQPAHGQLAGQRQLPGLPGGGTAVHAAALGLAALRPAAAAALHAAGAHGAGGHLRADAGHGVALARRLDRLLRFAAGVASALVFVYTSGWCLGQLARLGVPAMGAVIYTGPGAGIVLSGLAASGMVAWHWTAAAGWLVFGLLAAVLTALVWPVLAPRHELPAPAAQPPGSARYAGPPRRGRGRHCSRSPMAWPGLATSSRPPSCR
jgi:hypothetical protein